MDDSETIEYEYQGRAWNLPPTLADLQVELAKAETECLRHLGDPDKLRAARARRLELTLQKFRLARPWWDTFQKYERWHADWALQDYGRKTAGLLSPTPAEVDSRKPDSSQDC